MPVRDVCPVCGAEVLRARIRRGDEVLLNVKPGEGGYVLTGLYGPADDGGKIPEAEKLGLVLFPDAVVTYSDHKH